MAESNKLRTSAKDNFKNSIEDLLYQITFYKSDIENVIDFGIGRHINHSTIGRLFFDKIQELRSVAKMDLISELENNYCNGFSLNHYSKSFNLFMIGISNLIQADWIFNNIELLPKYKSDFLNLNNEGNLFCDPRFFNTLHKKPFESLLHDSLFAVREINQQVNDFTKARLMDENPLSDIVKNADAIINNTPNFVDTPLKKLFKVGNKYDEVIKLMIERGLIIKTADGLQWHGNQRNAKYEAFAFLEVLSAKGLLSKKVDSDKYKIEILSGTFSGFTCSDKTARNKQINVVRLIYDALLNSI